MRSLLLLLIIVALFNCNGDKQPVEQPVAGPKMPDEGCVLESTSKLVSQRKISNITNLVTDTESRGDENQCTVRFDIIVDGKTHHLEETEIGLEQMASLCFYAKERAKANLLLDLGGEFKTETVTLCRQVDK